MVMFRLSYHIAVIRIVYKTHTNMYFRTFDNIFTENHAYTYACSSIIWIVDTCIDFDHTHTTITSRTFSKSVVASATTCLMTGLFWAVRWYIVHTATGGEVSVPRISDSIVCLIIVSLFPNLLRYKSIGGHWHNRRFTFWIRLNIFIAIGNFRHDNI